MVIQFLGQHKSYQRFEIPISQFGIECFKFMVFLFENSWSFSEITGLGLDILRSLIFKFYRKISTFEI